MKVIAVSSIKGTDREVVFDCGMVSNRLLLEKDGMGFTLTKTEIPAGDWRHWHYKKHLEACFCVSGKGLLLNKETGEKYKINPDIVYVLDNHDDHSFLAIKNTVLVCVFNPPLKGQEKHGKDGSYK